jgi:WXG100 family type VII secretion target
MTAYDVDLVELRAAVAELAACQRDLLHLGADVDHAQAGLRDGWAGRASDAQSAAYASWRDGCADMVTALAGLRAVLAAADELYSGAAASNLSLWQGVSA